MYPRFLPARRLARSVFSARAFALLGLAVLLLTGCPTTQVDVQPIQVTMGSQFAGDPAGWAERFAARAASTEADVLATAARIKGWGQGRPETWRAPYPGQGIEAYNRVQQLRQSASSTQTDVNQLKTVVDQLAAKGTGKPEELSRANERLAAADAALVRQRAALGEVMPIVTACAQFDAANLAGAVVGSSSSTAGGTATSSRPSPNPGPPKHAAKDKPPRTPDKTPWTGEPVLDPVPQPSSWAEIDRKYRLTEGTFPQIADRLLSVVGELGYSERSFYRLKSGGFALACRLEQINDNGAPLQPPRRWLTGYEPMKSFSIDEYMRRLFTAQAGRYRVVVFVVQAGSLTFVETTAQEAEMVRGLAAAGSTVLPASVAEASTPSGLRAYALTYEFRKNAAPDQPVFVTPGLAALDQLKESGFFQAFATVLP